MNEMIERCAEALRTEVKKFVREGKTGDWMTWEHVVKIVLKAAREPTDAMIDAGTNTFRAPDYADADQCYQAMIDVIIRDQ